MDYYLNEYSLRGQFESIEEFLKSLRDFTLPVLKKIQEEGENLIWKKENLWSSEICNGITLINIPKMYNERSAETTKMKTALIMLATKKPFWESDVETNIKVKEYRFDNDYRDRFEIPNCFTKAIENEGRIVSFFHPAYKDSKLIIAVECDDKEVECSIDHIYTPSWWDHKPIIKTWRPFDNLLFEIRANEFDFHPPHFHVSHNEYAAVFNLCTGKLYKEGKKKFSPSMLSKIKTWFIEHKAELQEAWESLHGVI